MPFYVFVNPDTGHEIEIQQKMTEPHVYIDENGLEWQRVFTPPQACDGMNHDPFNSSHFLSKTRYGNSKNFGEVQDRAKEDSERRASKRGGVDPYKQKWYKEYSKKRKGKKHPTDPSRFSD
jgi:hypothetical protein